MAFLNNGVLSMVVFQGWLGGGGGRGIHRELSYIIAFPFKVHAGV